MIKYTVFWFVSLLVILVAGFWPSYYSNLFGDELTLWQHLHGAIMTLWVLLLIAQAWLIRDRKNATHKILGKSSFVLAPLVILTGWYVNIDSTAKFIEADPFLPLAFFWLGYSDVLFFGVLWWLAIKHRKNMNLHARYMMTTGLVFLMPGLGRLLGRLFELDFQHTLIIPSLVAAGLAVHEWRKGKVWTPFPLFAGVWFIIYLGFLFMPKVPLWRAIADWHIAVFA